MKSEAARILMIAGGTDGIGFSLLQSELQRFRYSKILILGRDFSKVDRLVSEEETQQEITKLQCDVTKLDAIINTLKTIEDNSIHDFVLTIGTFHRGKIADVMLGSAAENEKNDKQYDIVADHFHLNCVSVIHLIRLVVPKLVNGDSQILVCTASLATMARSPYGLQSATKAALRSFIDVLRIELKGRTRVMNLMPPSLDTKIFAKSGDYRETKGYPPPSRVSKLIQQMLDCPQDICIPELLVELHHFDVGNHA